MASGELYESILPYYSQVSDTLLPSSCNAFTVLLKCCCHAAAMKLPWCYHTGAVKLPCSCQAATFLIANLSCCWHRKETYCIPRLRLSCLSFDCYAVYPSAGGCYAVDHSAAMLFNFILRLQCCLSFGCYAVYHSAAMLFIIQLLSSCLQFCCHAVYHSADAANVILRLCCYSLCCYSILPSFCYVVLEPHLCCYSAANLLPFCLSLSCCFFLSAILLSFYFTLI